MRPLIFGLFLTSLILAACSDSRGTPDTVDRLATALPAEQAGAILEARAAAREMLTSPLFGDTEALCESILSASDQEAWDQFLAYVKEQFGAAEERNNDLGITGETVVERAVGAILKEECARIY